MHLKAERLNERRSAGGARYESLRVNIEVSSRAEHLEEPPPEDLQVI